MDNSIKYRAVFQPKNGSEINMEVVSIYENDSNVVTTTGQKFLVNTITNLMRSLASDGVDISMFWRDGFADNPIPQNTEIEISDHPEDSNVKRKASVYSIAPFYTEKEFRYNLLIRHFDAEGNHITDQTYNDEFVSRIVDNSIAVPDGQGGEIGEYDFFYNLLESGSFTLIQLQDMRISIMDEEGLL